MAHDTQTAHGSSHGHGDSHGHHGDGHGHHGTTVYWMVFIALMILLVVTVLAAFVNMGALNVPVAYAIATVKAVLILWFFMHLNQQTRLVQVFAFASFAWLALFLIMISGDYISRTFLPRAQPGTTIRKVDSYSVMSGEQHDTRQPGLGKHGGSHAEKPHGPATQPAAPAH